MSGLRARREGAGRGGREAEGKRGSDHDRDSESDVASQLPAISISVTNLPNQPANLSDKYFFWVLRPGPHTPALFTPDVFIELG